MNRGLSKIAWFGVAGWIACLCESSSSVAQQSAAPQTAPIEFSEPNKGSVISNFNRSILEERTDDGLIDLLGGRETRTVNSGSSQSLQPATPIVRPSSPAVKSKKLMDLIEQRKDWVFRDPDEKEFGMTPEQIFNLPEQDMNQIQSEKLTPMERYFNKKDERSKDAASALPKDNDDSRRKPFQAGNMWSSVFGAPQDGGDLRFGQTYRDEPGYGMPPQTANSWSQPETGNRDSERARAQEARKEAFKRLLDPNYMSSPEGDSANTGGTWRDSAQSWGNSSPRPVVSPGLGAATSIKKPDNSYSHVSRPLGILEQSPAAPEAPSSPSLFPSLAPALAIEDKPRKMMPPPVFEMPKPRF